MKKALALLLSAVLLLSFAACEAEEESTSRRRKSKEKVEEETTAQTEEETTQPQVDVDAIMEEVLSDKRSFFSLDGQSVLLSAYLNDTLNAPAMAYTMVDMDADGSNELVLRLNNQEHSIMILHYDGADIYCYTFYNRAFTTLWTDGTYAGSAGAYVVIRKSLSFNGATVVENSLAYGDYDTGDYTVEGTECTESEFDSYVAQWGDKEQVQWTELEWEQPEPESTSKVPYTVDIKHLNLPIFDGPSYDHTVTEVVYTKGLYTITEEASDGEGNIWGKLKSGLGWIDLGEAAKTVPAAVSYAHSSLTQRYENKWTYYIDDSVELLLFVDEQVTDFSVVQVEHPWDSDQASISKVYGTLDTLNSGQYVSVTMAFYGDAQESDVGVRFTDKNGIERCFYITMGGRNNMLYLVEVKL